MTDTEMFVNFKQPQQISMGSYLHKRMGARAKALLEQCKKNIKKLSADDLKQMQQETESWCQNFKKAIISNLDPASQQVQKLVDQYYQTRVKRFCNPSKEELIQMIEAETSHPDYAEQYAKIHKKFALFFLSAIRIYAEKNLKK